MVRLHEQIANSMITIVKHTTAFQFLKSGKLTEGGANSSSPIKVGGRCPVLILSKYPIRQGAIYEGMRIRGVVTGSRIRTNVVLE